MKNLLNEIKAMNKIAGTQLTKEQEIALIKQTLKEANEREEPTISLEDAVKAMEDALTFAKKLGKQIANKKGGHLTEKDLARVVDNFRYKYKDYSQNKFKK